MSNMCENRCLFIIVNGMNWLGKLNGVWFLVCVNLLSLMVLLY